MATWVMIMLDKQISGITSDLDQQQETKEYPGVSNRVSMRRHNLFQKAYSHLCKTTQIRK